MTKKRKLIISFIVSILVLLVLFVLLSLFGKWPHVTAIVPVEIKPIHIEIPIDAKVKNIVDELLEKMEFGAIAFNAPTDINIDDSPQIQLLLSLSETVENLKKSVTEQGEKIGATIKVNDRMEAHLSGDMFQITAITPEIQAVSKRQQTEWKWEIHPKKEGKQKLYLTLTALLEIDGKSTPRAIRTFDKVIVVNVTAIQKIDVFFKNNWQWLWAAVLVPVAGWLWKRNKKKLTTPSS